MSPDPLTVTGIVVAVAPSAKMLLEKMLGPAAEEVGEHFRSRVRGFLTRNREAVVDRASQMVLESGREVREVPLRLMLPLLEGASREDNADLQERWAALMANAATAENPEDVPRIFAATLAQLTPLAAHFLDALADEIALRKDEPGRYPGLPRWGATQREVAERMGIAVDPRLVFTVDVLVRQN